MPGAQLSPSAKNAAGSDGQWQAVVRLLLLAPTGGTAKALVLTYHVGRQQFQLQGTIDMAVVKSESGCPAT